MIAIAKIFIFVLNRSWLLRQGPIADVIHFLGDFARWSQRPVTFLYPVANVIVVAVSVAIVLSTLAFATITVIVLAIRTL